MAKRERKSDPWEPAPYDQFDLAAVRAVSQGTASDDQQKRAFNWIVATCAGVKDLPWHPGGAEGARATDFANGKRFVGLQIVKLATIVLTDPQPTER